MLEKLFFIFSVISLMFVNSGNCADSSRFAVQEPKGDTMELVSFAPQKINFPFEIKYPAKWYVREDAIGMPSLFLTREAIKNDTDRYSVGVSLIYNVNYFSERQPPSSVLGQTAGSVIRIRDWEESKKQFIEGLQQAGNNVISQSTITISGQSALRVDFESKNLRATTLYIKVGIHLLAITFEAPPEEYKQYKDIFDKMLNSFFITR